ncbi:MAG TPA: hypothetical protein VIY68_04750 [Steroidobacteraceae bacterium]
MAVVRFEVLVQIRQIEISINTAEHVVRGHVVIEVEGVKQSVLLAAALSHHAGDAPFAAPAIKTLKTRYCSIVFQQNRPDADGHERPLYGTPIAQSNQDDFSRPAVFSRTKIPVATSSISSAEIGVPPMLSPNATAISRATSAGVSAL